MNFYIYTDASYRNKIACGAIVIDCNSSLIKREIYFKCANSTEAEIYTLYKGICIAKEILVEWPQAKIFVHNDEQRLVDYFAGACRPPKGISKYKFTINTSKSIYLRWIKREQNYLADNLCADGMSQYSY